jgi:hypothetical protein
MTSDSAVCKPQMSDPHHGLRLVHSRNAQQGRSRSRQVHAEPQNVRSIRDGGGKPNGAAAARVSPIARMGRALLRWMNVS